MAQVGHAGAPQRRFDVGIRFGGAKRQALEWLRARAFALPGGRQRRAGGGAAVAAQRLRKDSRDPRQIEKP